MRDTPSWTGSAADRCADEFARPDPQDPGARELTVQERRRAWKVRQRYLPERPTVVALLDQARRLEAAMRAAGVDVEPASVLIRTDGLTVAVTVHEVRSTAADTARALISHLAACAGIHPHHLGHPGDATVRPGWRPSSR